mmetsp:Transcript_8931/g.17200  ORF Transcript_8931/g.17200 Transcript_8931/m.17200 type:complete len:640 (+) Transcript_8931:121-2040(+)
MMGTATENATAEEPPSVTEDQVDMVFKYSLTPRSIEQQFLPLESAEGNLSNDASVRPVLEQPHIHATVSLQESQFNDSHPPLQLNQGSVLGNVSTIATPPTNDKPPKPDNTKPPHKILYPTRASIPNDSSSSDAIKWRGLEPLVMVRHIAEMALAYSDTIDCSDGVDAFREGRSFLRKFVDGGVSSSDGISHHPNKHLSDGEDTCSTAIDDIRDLNALKKFTPWNPKSVLENLQITGEWPNELDDNDLATKGEKISELISQLDSLVSDFEDLGVSEDMVPSYNRVMMLLNASVHRCEGRAHPHEVTINEAKDAVKQALDQVQTLMDMAKCEESVLKSKHDSDDDSKYASLSNISSNCPRLVATTNDQARESVNHPDQEKPHDSPIPANVDWESMMYYGMPPKPLNQAFNEQMNLWLRCNWANPFPDTEMLNHLVSHLITCGCMTLPKEKAKPLMNGRSQDYHDDMVKLAIEKVTNWLVNARTRKWRPSIQEAFDLKRPTFMLLEDSIRIFDGKAPRTIPGWDGDSFYAEFSDFSAPLHTWYNLNKRPKKTSTIKKRKTSNKNSNISAKQVKNAPDTRSLRSLPTQTSIHEYGAINGDGSSIPPPPLPALPFLESAIGESFDMEFLEALANTDQYQTFPI